MSKRIPYGIAVVAIVAAGAARAQQARPNFGGTLVFSSGKTLLVHRIDSMLSYDPKEEVVHVRHETITRDLKISEIARISAIEIKRNDSGNLLEGSAFTFLLRNGREVIATLSMGHDQRIAVEFLDELTGRLEKQKYSWTDRENAVREVVFSDDVGTLRWSTTTQNYFPPSFNFDPYTGEKLVWRTPVNGHTPEDIKVVAWACPACRSVFAQGPARCERCGRTQLVPARTNVMDHSADYFLQRAGLDANSDRARAAKRLSGAWLNPFASDEEIERALKEVIEASVNP